ncbi:MAG: hypothetical protein ACOC6R_01550 [Chloroflexota bacterium]
MPIRWSAMRVSEAADMMEKHISAAVEPLECAREVAKAALEIESLPGYMEQRIYSFLSEIDRAIGTGSHRGNLMGKLQDIRDNLPKADLEAEKKASSYGEMKSLV